MKKRNKKIISVADDFGYVIPAQSDEKFFSGGMMGVDNLNDMQVSKPGPMRIEETTEKKGFQAKK